MSSNREGVRKAMEAYLSKQDKLKKPSRKNNKPEKIFVEEELLPYMRSIGMSVHIVDSKAVYHPALGRYLNGKAPTGMSDIVGCDSNGWGVFIEAKAPTRRSTLRYQQKAFLIEKIECGAFAACVDNVDYFKRLYTVWYNFKIHRQDIDARIFLNKELP